MILYLYVVLIFTNDLYKKETISFEIQRPRLAQFYEREIKKIINFFQTKNEHYLISLTATWFTNHHSPPPRES